MENVCGFRSCCSADARFYIKATFPVIKEGKREDITRMICCDCIEMLNPEVYFLELSYKDCVLKLYVDKKTKWNEHIWKKYNL